MALAEKKSSSVAACLNPEARPVDRPAMTVSGIVPGVGCGSVSLEARKIVVRLEVCLPLLGLAA